MLAAIAAILEFIPMIGPFTAAVIILLVAAFSGYEHLLFVLIFLGVYRLFQDYVLSPRLLSEGMELHPLLVRFWALVCGHIEPRGSLAWLTEGVEVLTEAIEHPAVVHFTRGASLGRPWESRCTHPYRERWFEALDRTSWAGWRPQPPDTRLPARVARRLRRTTRTLLHG
jgi:hypothetical protein